MAEQLILFQADELSGIKAKYNGLAEEMQSACDRLKAEEAKLNACLSAMESVVGSGGGDGYFYNATWAGRQHADMEALLSVLDKVISLTEETNNSLRGKIMGGESAAAPVPAISGGDTTVQVPTASGNIAAASAALAGIAAVGVTGFSNVPAVSPDSAAAKTAAAKTTAAKTTTIGKNMARKTSIKTKNASGKTVTVKGTYDVVKNMDKFALDQRKYGKYTCTGTSWAMTRNINDNKNTLKPTEKSNWGSGGCKWPKASKVKGSQQNMLSAAYKQLQQGKASTIYGKYYPYGKSNGLSPHAVTIVGVKPTADPKKLKMSDFLVIDPWGGTTKNLADLKYQSLIGVYVDKS